MSTMRRKVEPMGRVLTSIFIENLADLWEVERGLRTADQVRGVMVEDALVDTGASTLSLPPSLIGQLGLKHYKTRPVRTAAGPAEARVFEAVRFTIQGRDGKVDVLEVPEGTPVLVGQVPLEITDFVVDPKNQCLICNPAHGGQWEMELY